MMRFTRIKSAFSEARRLPRLGKIRLGLKQQSARTGKEYPTETEFFVCPPEVQAVYGERPTELDVMFPLDDPEQIFVQKLAFYGSSSGLKCHGNGEQAEEFDDKEKAWKPRKCPCDRLDKGECGEQSHLMVLLPKVSMGGCYQITTGSYHSTVAINSALDYIRGLAGRIALLPMKLKRVPQEMTHDGKKRTHYTLSLVLDATLPQIVELRSNPASLMIPAQYQIEGPIESNPQLDPVDSVVDDSETVEAETLAHASDNEMDAIREKLKQSGAPTTDGNGTAQPPAVPHSHGQIDDVQWQEFIAHVEDHPDRAAIKKQLKEKFNCKDLKRLPIERRRPFILSMQDQCNQEHVKIDQFVTE